MKKDRKTTSAVEVMADLCGIPRKKLAKEIKALQKEEKKMTAWVWMEPSSGYCLFRNPSNENAFQLDSIGVMLNGWAIVHAWRREDLVGEFFAPKWIKDMGLKLKPVRITGEIREEK